MSLIGDFWNAVSNAPGNALQNLESLFGPGGIAPSAPPAPRKTRHGYAFGPGPNVQVSGSAFGGAGAAIQTGAKLEQNIAGDISSAGDFFSLIAWLFHPLNWLRMVEFVIGFILMLYGLRGSFRVFRDVPTPNPSAIRRITRDVAVGNTAARRQGRRQAQRSDARSRERNRLAQKS